MMVVQLVCDKCFLVKFQSYLVYAGNKEPVIIYTTNFGVIAVVIINTKSARPIMDMTDVWYLVYLTAISEKRNFWTLFLFLVEK